MSEFARDGAWVYLRGGPDGDPGWVFHTGIDGSEPRILFAGFSTVGDGPTPANITTPTIDDHWYQRTDESAVHVGRSAPVYEYIEGQ